MKPLLARSNSSPQNFVKRAYRPSSISPCHLIHYHGEGVSSGGLVGGWLGRRGSVPDHRQGTSQDNGGISNQSRSPAYSQKSSVDADAKQRNGQREEERKVAGIIAGNITASTNTSTIKSAREVTKELVKIRRHKLGMEEISHSIQRLEMSARQQIIRLSDTYDCVVGKLEDLQALTTRFAELQKLTAELVDNFTVNEERVVADMEGKIQSLGTYQEEVATIRMLQRRLDLQRKAVENYKSRLEMVKDKISRQKELEVVWRQRASRRLRILWGIISVLVIVWLLATSTHDIAGIDDGEEVDEQPPEQQSMEDTLGVKFEYGSLPKEVLSLEADRLLRERHRRDEP